MRSDVSQYDPLVRGPDDEIDRAVSLWKGDCMAIPKGPHVSDHKRFAV
jgi:hypothetical protein